MATDASNRLRLVLMACAATVVVGVGLLYALTAADKPSTDKDEIEEGPVLPEVKAENRQDTKEASSPSGEKKKKASAAKKELTEAEKELKGEFNAAKQKAFELFKADPPRYDDAAQWFTKAIDLATAHESLASQRVALYNNRSACRERVGALEASLADCASVLELNRTHAKVRRRRARIYEKLNNYEAALVEICADLLIQREDFKKALREGKQPEPPQPVENVEAVMRAVGKAAADAILEERDQNGVDFGMPSSNTITQLLMTYSNYDARRERAVSREADDDALAVELAGAATLPEKLSVRLRRATKWTYTKRYDDARAEVLAALAEFSEKEPASKESLPAAISAELWRQVGLYRHLAHDLAGARQAYDKSLEFETEAVARAETRVRAAGVCVDAGDPDAAEAELGQALREDPGSSDVFMHRAQLRVIKRDLPQAQKDLEKCIERAPKHVLARLRLATVLIHNQVPAADIEAQIETAKHLAPSMSEVYQVKGEILLARNDLASAVAEFDKAISLDASNPVPLYNKGMALIQMNSYDAPRTKELFEAALAVDPTCMVALMRLSELKLQLAATFDQAQEVVDMLHTATARCRDKDELVELATVKAMAVAQLGAAKLVGLTSFQS